MITPSLFEAFNDFLFVCNSELCLFFAMMATSLMITIWTKVISNTTIIMRIKTEEVTSTEAVKSTI